MNTFVSAHFFFFFFFFYSFCKLLSSQASSSFVFGINFFCVCVHLFFFFFYWMFLLDYFFVCTYLYKIYIDALKSLKCLKCIIHTKTKNLLPTGFPLMCYFLFLKFYFTVSLCFSRFSAFLFVCCDEFKSSVKRHRIIFSTSTELQSAVGEKRMCLY